MKEKFVIPSIKKVASDGTLDLPWSNKIKKFDIEALTGRRLKSVDDDSDDKVNKVSKKQELKILENYFKLSGTITVTLLPANELYSDKKGFTWELLEFGETKFQVNVVFDHPKYISVGGSDKIKIVVKRGKISMVPQDQNKNPVPDGFTLITVVPPQGRNVLSTKKLGNRKRNG